MQDSSAVSTLSSSNRPRKLLAALLLLGFAADAWVLRASWTGAEVAEGEFRRGYFEWIDGAIGLAIDNVIRPVFPSCVVTEEGALAVAPGMTAVVPLLDGSEYALTVESPFAPYLVIGEEAAIAPSSFDYPPLLPGEAKLADGRTLAIVDGQLALVPWVAGIPWRDDAARLTALRQVCGVTAGRASVRLTMAQNRLEIRFGSCTRGEPFGVTLGPRLLAAVAGPEWIEVSRPSGWVTYRWVVWPVLAAIAMKVVLLAWAVGLTGATVTSATLALAAVWWPIPAALTWPLTAAIAIVAALVRIARIMVRCLPSPRGVVSTAGAAILLLAGGLMLYEQPRSFPPIIVSHVAPQEPYRCAVIGYSTAGGASLRGAMLRRENDGIRFFLDQECEACRGHAASRSAGGETLDWLHEAFCDTAPSCGGNGKVVFLGGANDDFLWAVLSIARLFIVGDQGPQPWRRSQAPAAAAARARIDQQTEAIHRLIECVRQRNGRLIFLHDFLVTDLVAGRDPDRAAMLAARQAAVEADGMDFVDLYQRFAGEAGVSWFNDYIHPSLIGHYRFSQLACELDS